MTAHENERCSGTTPSTNTNTRHDNTLKSEYMSRDFKGIWIPREIWLHESLCANEKVLWSEINSLFDRSRGGCYAPNDYLAKVLGVKERRVQEMMAHLKSLGLVEQVSFDGRERVIRAITPCENLGCNTQSIDHQAMGDSQKSPHLRGAEKCTSAIQNNAPLPTNIEQRREHNTNNTGADAQVAVAPIVGVLDSPSPKSSNAPTPDAIRLQSEIETAMMQSPLRACTWKPPKSHFLAHQCDILMRDGATYSEILNIAQWAVTHEIWGKVFFCQKTNPGTQLRKRFSQLFAAFKGEQTQKKTPVQRFGRTSSEERLDEAMRKFNEGFTDA